jgi:phage gp46-like protein
MSDISTIWIPADGIGTWSLNGVDLASGNDLVTAVLISLFTERQAEADDGEADRRGWWADPQLGSRLWLLRRAKRTEETRRLAEQYSAEALQWLIDDGVVGSFNITFEWDDAGSGTSMLAGRIVAHRNDGTSVPIQFSWVWNAI